MTDVSGVGSKSPYLKAPDPQTPPPVPPRQGRTIGGKVSEFFKPLGEAIRKPFVSLGKSLQKLDTQATLNRTGFEPKTLALVKKYDARFTAHETHNTRETRQAKSETLSRLKQALFDELQGGGMYQEALQETRMDLLNNKAKGYFNESPKEALESAMQMIAASPTKLMMMKQYGITIHEAVAIHIYTSGAYVGINAEVRAGNESPLIAEIKANLLSGLAKLPPVDGPLYRAMQLTPNLDSRYQTTQFVSDPGIMSTTKEGDYDFSHGAASHYLTMVTKDGGPSAGRDVAWLSESPHEQEVIFPPGTQFKVLHRDNDNCPKPTSFNGLGGPEAYDQQVRLILSEV